MKYKLECIGYDGDKIIFEFEATGLEEMLEQYGRFLRAAGFQNKELIEVEDEDNQE